MNPKDHTKWAGVVTVLFLLGSSFVFAKFQGGFVSWFIFYACLIFSLYEAIVLFNGMTGFKAVRILKKKHFSAGEEIEVGLELTRPYPFPVPWLIMTDEYRATSHQGYHIPFGQKKTLIFPWFKRRFHFTYTLGGLERGVYQFHQVILESGDLFGLIRMKQVLPIRDEIVVYPRYHRLSTWASAGRQGNSPRMVNHRQVGDETTVVGARDYAIGDKLSKIHWKASAKGTDWKTKEFEAHSSHDFLFVLNTNYPDYEPMSDAQEGLELAIQAAASLSYTALQNKGSFSLMIPGEKGGGQNAGLSRHTGDTYARFVHILRKLAMVGFLKHPVSFDRFLQENMSGLRAGDTLVCITPVVTEESVRIFRRIQQRNVSVEVFFISSPGRDANRHVPAQLMKYGIRTYVLDHPDLNHCLVPVQQEGRKRYRATGK
ncbi:MAG: DUF58 domain-containing protein [Bacillaceae bacterium]|nr:DUF58 domain-containing protein [Bacillaceae bacterium]